MKIISLPFSESMIQAFGWTLIHSLWQGTLLALLAALSFYMLRKAKPNARYVAGVSSIVVQVVLSVITFAHYYVQAPAASITKPLPYAAPSTMIASGTYSLPVTLKAQLWIAAHLNELVICWLIGAAFLLLRFAGGWFFTETLRSKASIVMDREWRARFGVIVAKMNIKRSIELRETARIVTPMVIGAFSPAVLLPIGLLSGLSTAQVEAILAHELAHIRRNDYLINLLQSFVEVVFFFHPAIWWLSERVRAEREHCCDDIALSVCGDKMTLAHALVKVDEWQSAPQLAMAFASGKPLLLQRIQRVLGIQPKAMRPLGNWPVMLIAASLVISLSFYAVGQKSETKQQKRTSKQMKAEKKDSLYQAEDVEIEAIANIQEETIPDIDIELIAPIADTDSSRKKMNEFHRKMEAFQEEMSPIQRKMEDLHLEMEKQRFEVERVEREVEKIEWKKEQAVELRSQLMEKRSALLHHDGKSNQTKSNEVDLEKQLGEFEQQIKVQEQRITELNSSISSSRKEAIKSEEPLKRLESEMELLQEQVEEISGKIEVESKALEKYHMAIAPRAPKAPRAPRKVKPVPPAPPAAAPAPPVPPSGPAKK